MCAACAPVPRGKARTQLSSTLANRAPLTGAVAVCCACSQHTHNERRRSRPRWGCPSPPVSVHCRYSHKPQNPCAGRVRRGHQGEKGKGPACDDARPRPPFLGPASHDDFRCVFLVYTIFLLPACLLHSLALLLSRSASHPKGQPPSESNTEVNATRSHRPALTWPRWPGAWGRRGCRCTCDLGVVTCVRFVWLSAGGLVRTNYLGQGEGVCWRW